MSKQREEFLSREQDTKQHMGKGKPVRTRSQQHEVPAPALDDKRHLCHWPPSIPSAISGILSRLGSPPLPCWAQLGVVGGSSQVCMWSNHGAHWLVRASPLPMPLRPPKPTRCCSAASLSSPVQQPLEQRFACCAAPLSLSGGLRFQPGSRLFNSSTSPPPDPRRDASISLNPSTLTPVSLSLSRFVLPSFSSPQPQLNCACRSLLLVRNPSFTHDLLLISNDLFCVLVGRPTASFFLIQPLLFFNLAPLCACLSHPSRSLPHFRPHLLQIHPYLFLPSPASASTSTVKSRRLCPTANARALFPPSRLARRRNGSRHRRLCS